MEKCKFLAKINKKIGSKTSFMTFCIVFFHTNKNTLNRQ
jgi:hypothetical protein